MKKYVSIILILCITQYSCTNNENKKIIVKKITVDFSKFKFEKSKDAIMSYKKLVKLESKENAYLRGISKVLVTNNNYLVLDTKSKTISQFDENGYLVRKLNQAGRGPNEYIHIADFNLNSDSTGFYILDNRRKRLLEYSLDNTFLGAISFKKLPYNAVHSFKFLSDNIIVFRSLFNIHRVVVYNIKKNKVIAKSKFVPKWITTQTPLSQGELFMMNNKLCYYEMYDQYIYEVNELGIKPLLYIDFGDEQFLDINKLSKKNSIRMNGKIMKERDWIPGIHNLKFSNNKLMFNSVYDDESFTVVYDMIREKSILFKFQLLNEYPHIINSQHEIFYSALSPSNKRDIRIIKKIDKDINMELLNETDNYYILETCLKK